jgi:hypothetical protein
MGKELVVLSKCIGNAVIDDLPEILEPLSKYGAPIGKLVQSFIKGYSDYKAKKEGHFQNEGQIWQEADAILKAAAKAQKPPVYADYVILFCKDRQSFSNEQKENLQDILQQEFSSTDTRSLDIIRLFADEYMGSEIDVENVDECNIGDSCLSFNFFNDFEETERRYDEEVQEDVELVMQALNALLGVNILDCAVVGGHNEME